MNDDLKSFYELLCEISKNTKDIKFDKWGIVHSIDKVYRFKNILNNLDVIENILGRALNDNNLEILKKAKGYHIDEITWDDFPDSPVEICFWPYTIGSKVYVKMYLDDMKHTVKRINEVIESIEEEQKENES